MRQHVALICYVHDVRPSVRLSVTSVCLNVTLVDCDHIVQQNVQMGTSTSVSWLHRLHAEVDPGLSILLSRILLRKTSWVWKHVEFCSSVAMISACSYGSHVARSRHLL